jgi:nicotinate phosphoribosyltransferase
MGYSGRERFDRIIHGKKVNTYREILAEKNAMWTDLYELTMAQALFRAGLHNQIATFHYFHRASPFKGQPLFTGGQNILHEFFDRFFKFDDLAITLLSEQVMPHSSAKIFQDENFLNLLRQMKNELTIEAMPEGEIAFPQEPIYRVTGPLYQCLIAESAILNTMNSQSLFVTYANMYRRITDDFPLMEGGMRRAQAVGGIESSRAGFIGGFDHSTNCNTLYYYGAPQRGTMAHAFIMLFENEIEAINTWLTHAAHMPIFLVDTYHSLDGVRHVIERCKEKNIILKGIRLDSGDLTYLSQKARQLLDEAGFTKAIIIGSNDLDLLIIQELKAQGAAIDSWQIGTNFVSAKDQPALGGVYKLAAVYDKNLLHNDILKLHDDVQNNVISRDQALLHVHEKMKVSEQPIKMTLPGVTDVIRTLDKNDKFTGDIIVASYDQSFITNGILNRDIHSIRPDNPLRQKLFKAGLKAYNPLIPIMKKGELIGDIETIYEARARVKLQSSRLDPSHLRLLNPHKYVAGIEKELYHRQKSMAEILRG